MVLLSSALTVPALDIKTLGGREFKNAKVLHQTR